jgi:hypothetical protein
MTIHKLKLLLLGAALTQTVAASPPPPAAAVGYNVLTFGPSLTIGRNWFPMAWNGVNPARTGVTQNADGSISIAGGGGNRYNAQLVSVSPAPHGMHGFKGAAFGGGGYFEATLSFKNPPAGWSPTADGWPAWWGTGVESNFPRKLPQNVEADFMEFMDKGAAGFSAGMHNWYGSGSDLDSSNLGINTKVTLPAYTDFAKPHRYGWLWVPATSSSQGYTKVYFDGVQVGPTHTWDKNNGAAKPGPGGSSPFSALDAQHLQLVLGTGSANPMTVYNVSVWQKSASDNIGSSATVSQPGGRQNED